MDVNRRRHHVKGLGTEKSEASQPRARQHPVLARGGRRPSQELEFYSEPSRNARWLLSMTRLREVAARWGCSQVVAGAITFFLPIPRRQPWLHLPAAPSPILHHEWKWPDGLPCLTKINHNESKKTDTLQGFQQSTMIENFIAFTYSTDDW